MISEEGKESEHQLRLINLEIFFNIFQYQGALNFQKTKLILNSRIHKDLNKYTFVGITRK